MEEDEVKKWTKELFEKSGYIITPEPPVENGIIALDFFAYKNTEPKQAKLDDREKNIMPDAIWIECKGDVNLSKVLEGLIRTAFTVYTMQGRGVLSLPSKQYKILKHYKDFLNCGKQVKILDIENNQNFVM